MLKLIEKAVEVNRGRKKLNIKDRKKTDSCIFPKEKREPKTEETIKARAYQEE